MSTADTPSAVHELLDEWRSRALLALFAYNRSANRAKRWDTLIGGSSAILSAIAGTAVFATLRIDVSTWARILVGTVIVIAAILSSIHVFAGLKDRVEQYEKAGRRFGAIRRSIEQLQLSLRMGEDVPIESINSLRDSLDAAADNSPNAPGRIWARTRRHMKGDYTRWERSLYSLAGLPSPRALKPEKDVSPTSTSR